MGLHAYLSQVIVQAGMPEDFPLAVYEDLIVNR